MMDNRFALPCTNVRFGWDSIVGLVPGVGDIATSVVALVIVHDAWQVGAPRQTLAKMLENISVDLAVGIVPVFGDVFDVVWKANVRNADLLERHLRG